MLDPFQSGPIVTLRDCGYCDKPVKNLKTAWHNEDGDVFHPICGRRMHKKGCSMKPGECHCDE